MNGSFFSGRNRKDRGGKLVDAVLTKFNLVMGVSLVNSKAELLGGKIRPGYEKKFARQRSHGTSMWGSWVLASSEHRGKNGQLWREG